MFSNCFHSCLQLPQATSAGEYRQATDLRIDLIKQRFESQKIHRSDFIPAVTSRVSWVQSSLSSKTQDLETRICALPTKRSSPTRPFPFQPSGPLAIHFDAPGCVVWLSRVPRLSPPGNPKIDWLRRAHSTTTRQAPRPPTSPVLLKPRFVRACVFRSS
jgi:hypothetical protein